MIDATKIFSYVYKFHKKRKPARGFLVKTSSEAKAETFHPAFAKRFSAQAENVPLKFLMPMISAAFCAVTAFFARGFSFYHGNIRRIIKAYGGFIIAFAHRYFYGLL